MAVGDCGLLFFPTPCLWAKELKFLTQYPGCFLPEGEGNQGWGAGGGVGRDFQPLAFPEVRGRYTCPHLGTCPAPSPVLMYRDKLANLGVESCPGVKAWPS